MDKAPLTIKEANEIFFLMYDVYVKNHPRFLINGYWKMFFT